MFPPRATELAHLLLRDAIRPGDHVVDATAGNGHDTVFLAEWVGKTGKVIAMDIQQEAIESARRRVTDAGFGQRVEFHQRCHSEMEHPIGAGMAAAVMFNLGYLPGADHRTSTELTVTLRAIEAATRVITPGGMITIVCYPGHEAGKSEAEATEARLAGLTACGWKIAKYAMLATLRPAPFLLIAVKPR